LSVFNLMNAILGSGILGLSYAMAQLGIVGFFIICSAVALLAFFAIHLLLKLCAQTGVKSYERLGFRAYGTAGKFAAAGCILLQNIGAMSSYMFIIKNQLPSVLWTMMCPLDENGETSCPVLTDPDIPWYFNGNYIVILVVLIVVVPLASLKSIEFLGYTSGFSIGCMVFFTIIIVIKYFLGMEKCPLFEDSVANGTMPFEDHEMAKNMSNWDTLRDDYLAPAGAFKLMSAYPTGTYVAGNATTSTYGHIVDTCPNKYQLPERYCNLEEQVCDANMFTFNEKTVYAMPTMTFSFVCHTAVLPIFAELKSGCPKQMKKIASTSIAACFFLYFIASVFGYMTFYNYVQSDLLLTYNHSDPRNALTLVVRICVLIGVMLTLPLTHFPARKAVNFLVFPQADFAWKRHLGIMACLLALCLTLVINVPDIKEIFGFVGASASGALMMILPPLFYLKINDEPLSESRNKKIAMGFLIFGCCFSTLTLGIMIYAKIAG